MKRKELFWGWIFILAAVFFVLSQFGYISGINLFGFFATAILLYIMIKNIFRLNFFGIFFPAAFILIIFDDELKLTAFTPWPALLTALLLSIGFSMIIKRRREWSFFHIKHNHYDDDNIVMDDGKSVNCTTVFGDCIKYVNSTNFKKANISITFGDIKIYFDKAVVPSGKADIHVNVSFGDVNLYVPRNWHIINKTQNFFGDLSFCDKSDIVEAETVEVTLHGSIYFGDVKIVYV